MFGIPDPVIWSGYLLTIVSLLVCIIYGAVNWNKGADPQPNELIEDIDWEEKDESIHEMI